MSDKTQAALVQSGRARPPRRGEVIALSVDSTARKYDLTTLDLDGMDPSDSEWVHVALQADGDAIYYQFADATLTGAPELDPAATISAGDPLGYDNAYGVMLANGSVHEVAIQRSIDTQLVVVTSSAAILRLFAASKAL